MSQIARRKDSEVKIKVRGLAEMKAREDEAGKGGVPSLTK